VLPAYNESAHIATVIAALPKWIDHIIVVDDASTDDTQSILSAIADDRITLIRHERNQGVGGAMVTGYRAALETDADIVVKMDADGQMLAADLPRLVRPLAVGSAEYAKGNRFYFRYATRDMPRGRGFGNSLLSLLTKAASGYWHVFDSQCGFTATTTPFLRLLDLEQIATDYFFENDMLIQLNGLGARVIDVPVTTVYASETSHIRVHRVALTFPPRLLSKATTRFWRKYLLTDFGIVAVLTTLGMALGTFGFIFGAYQWWHSIILGRAATTGTVMIAVLPIILGFQLLLQALSLNVAGSPGARETAEYVRLLIAEGEFE
jgi:hypothetical protein